MGGPGQNSADSGSRAYPLSEACERLSISIMQGYRLMAAGELQTYNVGKRRYVSEKTLRRFIQRRIRESAKETKEERRARTGTEDAIAGRQRQRARAAA